MFQSTLPRRERRRLFPWTGYFRQSFNPRSHAGSDRDVRLTGHKCITFQSTLPRRERLLNAIQLRSQNSFNPRSHAGSDQQQLNALDVSAGFNPRSHAGSDGCLARGLTSTRYVSIHAPTQGATATSHACKNLCIYLFQSTLPRRERPDWTSPTAGTCQGFNPRSHAGSDRMNRL